MMPLWAIERKRKGVRYHQGYINSRICEEKNALGKIAGERQPERKNLTRGTLSRLK